MARFRKVASSDRLRDREFVGRDFPGLANGPWRPKKHSRRSCCHNRSAIDNLPFSDGGSAQPLVAQGYAPKRVAVQVRQVTPGYLRALGIPVPRGRDILETDGEMLLGQSGCPAGYCDAVSQLGEEPVAEMGCAAIGSKKENRWHASPDLVQARICRGALRSPALRLFSAARGKNP